MDDSRFQELMKSVGNKAKSGPQEVVWNPATRSYGVQPKTKAKEIPQHSAEQLAAAKAASMYKPGDKNTGPETDVQLYKQRPSRNVTEAKADPQAAFNRFAKYPKTSSKYKVAEEVITETPVTRPKKLYGAAPAGTYAGDKQESGKRISKALAKGSLAAQINPNGWQVTGDSHKTPAKEDPMAIAKRYANMGKNIAVAKRLDN